MIRLFNRRNRTKSQAMVEFALSLFILIPLIFGTILGWRAFYSNWVYSQAAGGLSSWVSSAGEYNESMKADILAQMTQLNTNTSNTYLYMTITEPSGATNAIGQPPPSFGFQTSMPVIPASTGWGSTTGMDAPFGSTIRVVIWGYYPIMLPMTPVNGYGVVGGDATIISRRDNS